MSELPRCSWVLLPSLAAGLGKESDLIIFGNNSTNYRMWTKKHRPKLKREGGREVGGKPLCDLSVLQGAVASPQLRAGRRDRLSAPRIGQLPGRDLNLDHPIHPPPATCFLSFCAEAGDQMAACPGRAGGRDPCKEGSVESENFNFEISAQRRH